MDTAKCGPAYRSIQRVVVGAGGTPKGVGVCSQTTDIHLTCGRCNTARTTTAQAFDRPRERPRLAASPGAFIAAHHESASAASHSPRGRFDKETSHSLPRIPGWRTDSAIRTRHFQQSESTIRAAPTPEGDHTRGEDRSVFARSLRISGSPAPSTPGHTASPLTLSLKRANVRNHFRECCR
jgi:hypothetical protein